MGIDQHPNFRQSRMEKRSAYLLLTSLRDLIEEIRVGHFVPKISSLNLLDSGIVGLRFLCYLLFRFLFVGWAP
jgi:hypothetical protein